MMRMANAGYAIAKISHDGAKTELDAVRKHVTVENRNGAKALRASQRGESTSKARGAAKDVGMSGGTSDEAK